MEGPLLRIRYDGGDAEQHVIDLRRLGESLIGIDRIVSDGTLAIFSGRVPKKGERAPLLLKAKEPEAGSVDILCYLQESAWALHLGSKLISEIGGDLLVDWFKAVVYFYSGKKDLAAVAIESIVKVNEDHLAARDRSEERTRFTLADWSFITPNDRATLVRR